MSIIDKANQLGKLLSESDELNSFKDAEVRYLNDLELQEQIKKYKNMYDNYRKNQTDQLRGEIESTYNQLIQNNNFNDYYKYKESLDNLLSNVDELIKFHIDYQSQSSCCKSKGNCDGCNK